MSSTVFRVIVPQAIKNGDKVRIHATVANEANEFSINFVNDTCSTKDISYHFKWILSENVVVENWKNDGDWVDHKEFDYPSFDGPTVGLEFGFADDTVYVYIVHGEGRNLITYFEPEFELSAIKSIQVWGDVVKVNELNFLYA